METLLSAVTTKYDQICKKYFRDLSLNPFESLIGDGNECAKFIRAVLKDDDINQVGKDSTYYQFAKDRSTHAVLTYLIGLCFFDFHDLQRNIAALSNSKSRFKTDEVNRLWMLTSLYHDWGYTSKNVEKSDYKFRGKYDLFEDVYSDSRLKVLLNYSRTYSKTFAHTYDQIKAYGKYSRAYRQNENKSTKSSGSSKKPVEMIDHGILGGVTIFDRLIHNILKSESPSETELLLAKTSCSTIAQHNIFKSDSPQRDEKYREYCGSNVLEYLYYENGFSIGMGTPLLLLMCLVDTFECIKRFGQSEGLSQYLQTKTVLSNIEIEISKTTIMLDYRKLLQYIREEKKSSIRRTI